MATYQYQSLPISIPTKSQQSRYSPLQQSAYSVSPPEAAESVSSGSGMDATYSVATSSYAGSQSGDYETSSANGIDFQEYMQDRFSGAFDPLPLDRTLVIQAQTSGLLNSKNREILDLQASAKARLERMTTRFAAGVSDAKEVRRDLEWTQKRVSAMKTKAARKHPKEYAQAHARYPSPEY